MSVPHQKRPELGGVVHVTQKICAGLPRLRTPATFGVIEAAVRTGSEKPGFRVVAFTVLSNHFHWIIEARDNVALARGMQGLAIRVAKALNRRWRRSGKVFRERFFARAVKRASAMRRVVVYVLQNARRHGVRLERGRPDPYSSGAWYRFWHGRPKVRGDPAPVARSRHPTLAQILSNGIGLDEVPGHSSSM